MQEETTMEHSERIDKEAALVSASVRNEAELKSRGQRETSDMWERTQRQVALWVISSSLFVAVVLAIFGKWLGFPEIQLAAVVALFSMANNLTGFYFGRTNHTKVGGVGGSDAGTR